MALISDRLRRAFSERKLSEGSIAIVGTRGFSLVSQVAVSEGRVDPFTECIPCDPGESTISIGASQMEGGVRRRVDEAFLLRGPNFRKAEEGASSSLRRALVLRRLSVDRAIWPA